MPSYSQGKKVIWDSITNDGQRILDYFPDEFIIQKNSQEMKIRFGNQSLFQIIGSENIDSLMGTNPKIVVFSEYALQSPIAWTYLSPILKVNGGTAVFISTPRGKNHFHDLFNHARTNSDWFCQKLTIEDTGVLTREQYQQEIAEGMSEETAMQEYYVSFDRGVEGSYYGKIIEKARDEKRIGIVPYDPSTVVNTFWDCGYGDSTAIIFGQHVGTEFRVIDCHEDSGIKMADYVRIIQNKPYVYGTHYMPHDAASGSLQTGMSIQKTAQDLGLKVVVLPRDSIEVGIEKARALLSTCFIDAEKCKRLLKCLENYHKRFNDKLNVYSDTPVHDWSSHFADAFRYCAMAIAKYGKGTSSLTADQIKDMRQRNLGW